MYQQRTPGGRAVRFHVRDGTSDVSVIHSTSIHDEYGLKGRRWEGWALDLGAHIGSVCIPLAMDNPGLSVIAVEALPENVEQLRLNVTENGLDERIHVVPLGLSGDDEYPVSLCRPESDADRYIANTAVGFSEASIHSYADPVSLSALLADIDEVAFAKMDCEGCEWAAFADPAIAKVVEVVGEFHNGSPEWLVEMLADTHEVTTFGDGHLGHFYAQRR